MEEKWEVVKEALAVHNSLKSLRKATWDAVLTDEDVIKAIELDNEHMKPLIETFFQATKEYNSYDRCTLLSARVIQEIIESIEEKGSE
jgi:hypothetical protein